MRARVASASRLSTAKQPLPSVTNQIVTGAEVMVRNAECQEKTGTDGPCETRQERPRAFEESWFDTVEPRGSAGVAAGLTGTAAALSRITGRRDALAQSKPRGSGFHAPRTVGRNP